MTTEQLNTIDIFHKFSTMLIALVNIILVIFFFFRKDNKEDQESERNRRLMWLKTLVLDHNLKHFYDFFDKLEQELKPLKGGAHNLAQKQAIDEEVKDAFQNVRRNFTDTLLAVDQQLYQKVLDQFDDFQDHLTEVIFDEGINLHLGGQYSVKVETKRSQVKTEILKILFGYR